jgi:hypothetical protein
VIGYSGSFITDFINPDIIPFCNFKIGAKSKRLSSFSIVAFFGGLPFAQLCFHSELL